MKKIIILEDDKEEQLAAIEAVKRLSSSANYYPCLIDITAKGIYGLFQEVEAERNAVGGILTDLIFNPLTDGDSHPDTHKIYKTAPPPGGMLALIYALFREIPIVVCTCPGDLEHHHHSAQISWIFDGLIDPLGFLIRPEKLPFGWIESISKGPKDWEKATEELLKRIA